MSGEEVRSVGIWIRVSTEDQAKGESPEHHEKRARAYAEAKGWHVAEMYRLEAVSGKAVMGHPEAARMLRDIRSGAITALVFSKLARLARSTKDLLEFAEIFRSAGADLVSLQEAIDTSTPAGRLFFTMIAAIAQWEREEIADRVSASVAIRAKLGKPTGGAAVFGYRWNNKQLEPDPEEAPVRVLMHELFAEHGKLKRVARILNERGYRTRKGAPFSDTTIGRLLEDPTAKGLHRVNYTRTSDRTKAWEHKPESEWIYQPVPAIISEELWDRCASRQRTAAPGRGAVHLFAGFAYCACGTKMYVWANSPKYICAACRNKIPIDDLEEVFRAQLSQYLISPAEIAAHAEAASEVVRDKEALVTSTEADLRKLASESDKLYALYMADSLSKEDFGRLHKPLSARRSQLEDELPRLQAELDVLKIGIVSREAALSDARDLASRWTTLPFPERRQIVETITDRIVIGKAEVDIALLYTPSARDAGKATHAHGCVAFLPPGVPLHLKALKPEAKLDQGDSLGARLRRRRRELGLLRADAAYQLGTDEKSLMFWERDERVPFVSAYPAIITYLGYEPWEEPDTLGAALLAERRKRGLEIRRAAALVAADERTWRRWERGEWRPTSRTLSSLDDLFGYRVAQRFPNDVR